MCLTTPARVLTIDAQGATVLLGGHVRRASTLVVPEVRPGDWVVVGAGTILERIDQPEAAYLAAAVTQAYREEA